MRRRLPFALLFSACFLLDNALTAARAEPGADYYVSPAGNDAWSGRLAAPNAAHDDGPLATVRRAQMLVREMKHADPGRARPVRIVIGDGCYQLDAPWELTPEDSGTSAAPVIYEAAPHARPVLSGGRTIGRWRVDRQGRWHTMLPEVKAGQWYFAQLFVGDQRRFRPRWPEHGYLHVAAQLPPSEANAKRGHDRFGYAAGDLRAEWQHRDDLEAVVFHTWSTSRLRIASLDPTAQAVTFTGPTRGLAPWAAFPKGNRYFVDNVREALHAPGQWYLDRKTGELTYIPLPGEKPETTRVVAPRLPRLVTLAGDPAAHRWVENIQLRGLTLAHANWTLPPQGESFPQADVQLDAALSAVGARHVAIDSCAVRHVGGYAMAFGAGCRDNRIEHCELVDLGGGGIKIGHAAGDAIGEWGHQVTAGDLVASHHTVRQCLIAHGGRLHPAAVGIWIGHSPHNVLDHNEIHDFYYTGISVGWIWGYAASAAHHNDIGHNHVYNLGQHVLSDMGGIYSLGVSPGTVIHHNRFHDIQSFGYGGWGLYTDEGSSDMVLEKNLVYRTKTGGFHQHYGRDNRVRNNIFAFGTEQQLQRTRTEPHTSFFFEHNIVYWDNASPLLGSNWHDDHFKLDYNLYFRTGGKAPRFPGDLTLAQWQAARGQDAHSRIADPRFVDPEHGDFRLKPGSPAAAIGFEPWDLSDVGRRHPPVLTRDLPVVPQGFE
jgi:hypothetical protein